MQRILHFSEHTTLRALAQTCRRMNHMASAQHLWKGQCELVMQQQQSWGCIAVPKLLFTERMAKLVMEPHTPWKEFLTACLRGFKGYTTLGEALLAFEEDAGIDYTLLLKEGHHHASVEHNLPAKLHIISLGPGCFIEAANESILFCDSYLLCENIHFRGTVDQPHEVAFACISVAAEGSFAAVDCSFVFESSDCAGIVIDAAIKVNWLPTGEEGEEPPEDWVAKSVLTSRLFLSGCELSDFVNGIECIDRRPFPGSRGGCSMYLTGCTFTQCEVSVLNHNRGSFVADECVFKDSGRALELWNQIDCRITKCSFTNAKKQGVGAFIHDALAASIYDCRFHSLENALYTTGVNLDVRRCEFSLISLEAVLIAEISERDDIDDDDDNNDDSDMELDPDQPLPTMEPVLSPPEYHTASFNQTIFRMGQVNVQGRYSMQLTETEFLASVFKVEILGSPPPSSATNCHFERSKVILGGCASLSMESCKLVSSEIILKNKNVSLTVTGEADSSSVTRLVGEDGVGATFDSGLPLKVTEKQDLSLICQPADFETPEAFETAFLKIAKARNVCTRVFTGLNVKFSQPLFSCFSCDLANGSAICAVCRIHHQKMGHNVSTGAEQATLGYCDCKDCGNDY